MSLPKANCSFVIPSIHDDLELDCRIYYPRRTELNTHFCGKAFAIVAHPYAPLGGSCDDPVVGLTGSILLQHGCIVATFNFRGASGSAGRTSWSGKAELADYVSIYGLLLCYIDALYRTTAGDDHTSKSEAPLLILGGYSYGAMITSHLPSVNVVADLFNSPTPGSAESEIKIRAADLARDARAYLDSQRHRMTLSSPQSSSAHGDTAKQTTRGVVVGGYESDAASRRVSRESSRRSIDGDRVRHSIDRVRRKINARLGPSPESDIGPPTAGSGLIRPSLAYILISPLLPPVAGFITMFSKLRFTPKARHSNMPQAEYEELATHPCCCLFGSRDVFTSDRKLQRWTEELSSRPGSRFTAIRADAGHFWHEARGVVRLQEGLSEWLRTLTPRGGEDQETDKAPCPKRDACSSVAAT